MVLTIEPGLYIPDDEAFGRYRGIGVRIEDDVAVTGGWAYGTAGAVHAVGGPWALGGEYRQVAPLACAHWGRCRPGGPSRTRCLLEQVVPVLRATRAIRSPCCTLLLRAAAGHEVLSADVPVEAAEVEQLVGAAAL